jgi:hypothetical protein
MAGPGIEKSTWASADGLRAFLVSCIRCAILSIHNADPSNQNRISTICSLRLLKLVVEPGCLSDESLDHGLHDEDECGHTIAFSEALSEVTFELQFERARNQARLAADLVFDTLTPHCPRFVALVVEFHTDSGDSLGCVEYLRSKQIDIIGKTTYVGQPVKRGTVRNFEPCSDVLQSVANESLL